MKNKFLLCALLCSITVVNAQELLSKKGEKMLPDSGDWAIAVDAAPFLTTLEMLFLLQEIILFLNHLAIVV